MTEQELIERGKQIFQQSYNGVIPLPETIEPNSFGEMNMKLFADVLGDERLSWRDKRLLILGVIAGRAASPDMFEIHVKSALRNGELTVEELRAALKVMFMYAGAPAASVLFLALEKVVKAMDTASS